MNFGGHSIQFDYFVILLKSLDLIARTLHRIGFGLFDFSAYLFSLWQTACTQKLDSRRAHRNKVEKNNNNSNVIRARCTITNKSMRAEERVMERMRRVEQLCGECGPFNCTQSPANVLINAHRFIWFIVFLSLLMPLAREWTSQYRVSKWPSDTFGRLPPTKTIKNTLLISMMLGGGAICPMGDRNKKYGCQRKTTTYFIH